MKKLIPILGSAFLLLAHTASAQATRTWVSGVGDDANPCSRTAPGKTFAGAISKTAAKGTINVLDPGGFGAVTITKSITIDGGGVEGNILAAGVNGIIINAGVDDVVILRNLQLSGAGTGLAGIKIICAGAVYVENCRIERFATGIQEVSTASGGTQVFINKCIIQECTTAGVSFAPTGTVNTESTIESTRIQGCAVGLSVGSRSTSTINDCTISQNTADGLQRLGSGGTKGVIDSYRSNRVFGNSPDGTPTSYLLAK
ncbi:right-handed parallel beta-helix repeat-containing protein [Luteolibacter sp. LG18]|uniref:right-handed parallel beta-helix repeat-containing protein n=1 Tax=Luteolibacter sp. LG18 TaxID=2819286 RepID=UPI002B2C764C|nr:outer membrane protein B [Luteolibacter sp. LG18]